ncbi:hypothetical protein GCM10008932_00420 [Alkalibacterium iburiense]|uniref:Uncharacterized protein n=1 Tax=Alkalibacterium iburiense TaxID=290589 RepID=A0ABP3GSX7_9LACT
MIKRLKDKLNSEYTSFKVEMMAKSKEDIFDSSYKISAYEEIKHLLMNELPFTGLDNKKTIDTLLKTENLIKLVYLEFLNNEAPFPSMEDIYPFIDKLADPSMNSKQQ